MGTHFACASTDRDGNRARKPVRCKLYDARAPEFMTGLNNVNIMDQVSYLKQMDKAPPFLYLLSHQESVLEVNTVFGNVPIGSYLPYQLQDFGRPNKQYSC